jgi:hypothetical protein
MAGERGRLADMPACSALPRILTRSGASRRKSCLGANERFGRNSRSDPDAHHRYSLHVPITPSPDAR